MSDDKKNSEITLEEGHRLPEIKTLLNAAKLSIVEDRPIMMDYWIASIEKTVMIGIREDGKKMLIKNAEEYTSYIEQVFRINGKDYIIKTENSLYIVDSGIPSKRVSFDNWGWFFFSSILHNLCQEIERSKLINYYPNTYNSYPIKQSTMCQVDR